MKIKYKKQFKKIADELFKINQQAIKDKDEEAKEISCYLIEIMEGRGLYWMIKEIKGGE